MEIMGTEEFEKETVRLALAGDAKAGIEALALCRGQLAFRKLSSTLADYLYARLNDVLDGIQLDKALCVHKGPGQPANPFPEWKENLGAFSAVLSQRGYKPQKIAEAMCDQRSHFYDKPLETSDAHKIRKTYEPMLVLDLETLLHYIGPYRKVLSEYPPPK